MNKCKLGDLFYIKQGYAFKSEKYVSHSNYILCTLANFSESNNFKFSSEKATYYPDEFSHEFILCENDLIIPLTEQVVGLFGNTAFVPKTEGFQFVLNQRVGKIIPYEEKADKLFLHYLLSTQLVRDQIEATASGTKQRNTSPDKIYDVTVWVPNIDQQRIIGRYLYSLEQKCNVNNKICSELETMAKTLYDYWFVQFDFPDENGKPYRTSGGEMVWNEQLKREIPKGWGVTSLGDICDFRNGINYDKGVEGDQEYRIINVRNISSSSLLLNEAELDKITLPSVQADKYLLSSNDIVIARSGTPGATRLMWKINDPTIFCGFIICSTPHEALHKIYLTYCLKSLEGTSATKTGGSILQNVSQDTLKSLFVLIPDEEVLRQFNAVISPILEKIHSNIDENNELTKLRDWLLPMLMNGQARVE